MSCRELFVDLSESGSWYFVYSVTQRGPGDSHEPCEESVCPVLNCCLQTERHVGLLDIHFSPPFVSCCRWLPMDLWVLTFLAYRAAWFASQWESCFFPTLNWGLAVLFMKRYYCFPFFVFVQTEQTVWILLVKDLLLLLLNRQLITQAWNNSF